MEIGPVEAGDENVVGFERELRRDVGSRGCVGGGGDGQAGDLRPATSQLAEGAVLGAELVAPLADAVSFIDREQGPVDFVSRMQEPVGDHAFRGDIEDIEGAGAEFSQDIIPFARPLR